MFKAVVAEELAHVRPVFLFAVGVVVLAESPAAGPRQLHRPSGQMPVQRPVQELPAVVGVEILHRIRHHRFELAQLLPHRRPLLFQTARFSVQPLNSSVNVSE